MAVWRTFFTVLVLVALVPQSAVPAEEDAVFPIREESVLDEDGNLHAEYLRYGGAGVFGGPCRKMPTPRVTYPALKSESPLYGQVVFRTSLDTPADVQAYCFALDATGTDASKYDVLYFDANRDQDLTNDAKIVVAEKPPSGLSLFGGTGGAVCIFDYVELKDAQQDTRAERFLPWLSMQSRNQAYLIFMSTVVRKGTIRIGQQAYEALLGNRWQGGAATVLIKPEGSTETTNWKSLALESLQQEQDQFFTMSVDAKGEQLTVSPYRGEYGELSIKTDEHAPQKVGLAGSFYGKDRSRFSLGDFYAADFSRQYRIPAGDYRASLYVNYGDLRVALSSQGYDMQIRDGQPIELQFADKPTVSFTTPAEGKVFRPGDQVQLKAMLKDAGTGMLLRGLYDTTKTTQQRAIRNADGTSRSVPIYESLVPTVTIVDAAGKEVASGQMPFG